MLRIPLNSTGIASATDFRPACSHQSLENSIKEANWRKQAVEQGPLSLLERKPLVGLAPKPDGEQEARLTKLACSDAPKGCTRWSLRLLAEPLDVVHSAGAGRGVRLPDGASAGNLQAACWSSAFSPANHWAAASPTKPR